MLREVAEAYTAYEEERCTYQGMSIQRRKRSLISHGLKEAWIALTDVQVLMGDISILVVTPSVVLTPAGSPLIDRKLKKLTELTAKLAILKITMSKVVKRLEVRNSQLHSRGSLCHGQIVRFLFYNPPELL